MTLIVSISGVRGIAGESLNEKVVSDFAKAFSQYLGKGKKVVIGSDTRLSGPSIKDIVVSTLCKEGSSVIDVGIAPTPTVQLAVRNLKADGGIIITASHNPPPWNGLKFVRDDGIFLNETQAKKLISLHEKISKENASPENKEDAGCSLCCTKDLKALDHHIETVFKNIDIESIRKRKFKVAIDCCNGAGSVITQEFLRRLDCEIIAINTDTGKEPPRGSEPIPENLKTLCKIVRDFNADAGFAQDPDADRLSIVSDEAVAIGEEYTLALCADFVLSTAGNIKNPTAVTNLSTSRMIEDVMAKYKGKVIRTKVGEVNVSEKIKETGAIIGGEGNGGVIYPKVGFGRDSISGIGLMLNYMAFSGKKISELARGIPKYYMIKDKINLDDKSQIQELLNKVKDAFIKEKTDTADGIKIDLKEGWVHVRGSNTEPIVRIIAESNTLNSSLGLIEKIKALV